MLTLSRDTADVKLTYLGRLGLRLRIGLLYHFNINRQGAQ